MSIDVAEPDRNPRSPHRRRPARVVLDVVVPVYNEQADAGRFGAPAAPPPARAVPVSRSGSPSPTTPASTPPRRSPRSWPPSSTDVRVVRLEEKGRGRALHAVWATSDAPVLAYMDVDLSTDLAALLPLVAPLISGHSDLAIGTRLGRGSRVVRGPKREIISRCYNLILQSTLAARLLRRAVRLQGDPRRRRPAPAAARRRHRLVLRHRAAGAGRAQRACASTRCRSTGSTTPTAGSTSSPPRPPTSGASARLLRGFASGAHPGRRIARAARLGAARPAAPGSACCARRCGSPRSGSPAPSPTCCCSCCCAGLTGAQAANLVALLVTAIGNTAANRRFTFGVRGRDGAARHQFEGLLVFGIGLAITSGSLALLTSLVADREPLVELVRPGGRQPARHRRPLRPAARLGVPPAPTD